MFESTTRNAPSHHNHFHTSSTWVVTTMALDPFRCETSAVKQGANDGAANCGTELSEGIGVGGNGGKADPTPLDYLKDPNYGAQFCVIFDVCSSNDSI